MANALRTDLDAALASLGKIYALQLAVGGFTFWPDRITLKVEGLTSGGKSKEQELYEANAGWMGLPPFGCDVTIGREVFVIKGMKARGKNNILMERKKDGKGFVCPAASLPKVKTAPTMPLAEFVAAVQVLQKGECDRLNADKTRIFGAEFLPYPESMLAIYHREGGTPAQALADIAAEAEAEARFEARAS